MEFVDDGKFSWKEIYQELSQYIINKTFNDNDFNNIYNDLKLIKDFIYDIIHNKLARNLEIRENETDIRTLCKFVMAKLLPFITKKINEINILLSKKENNKDVNLALMVKNYLELEDDLYAIASFRSLIHFANYMERQDDKSQWVWKYNMDDTMGGIFYYSNQMILDRKYEALIKQCPTGYG